MIDINRLHTLFFKEEGYERKEGHTTLFVWQLIGLAETDAFSYKKINDRIMIPYNKSLVKIFRILTMIKYTCQANDIDFSISRQLRFVIKSTAFEFFEIPFEYSLKEDPDLASFVNSVEYKYMFSSMKDNDAVFQEWELTGDMLLEELLRDSVDIAKAGFIDQLFTSELMQLLSRLKNVY